MSTISSTAVKALRDRTNAPMMECKAALTEAQGDMEKAVDLIRKKFAGIKDKRGDRETAEGRVAIHIDAEKKLGGIVELRCESAPVAKNDHFIQLADEVAKQVSLKGAKSVDDLLAQPLLSDAKKTVGERIGDVIGLIRENMRPARFTQLQGGLLGSYVHHDGSIGVLLQVEGDRADAQMLRDVCMHITAKNPVAARREDVPAEVIAKEKEIAQEQLANDPKNKGKPANILEKIIEGKIKTWLAENVLLDQPFVKDDSKSVGDLLKGAGLKLVKYVRYKVGEK
jgi:elongation factor Ts